MRVYIIKRCFAQLLSDALKNTIERDTEYVGCLFGTREKGVIQLLEETPVDRCKASAGGVEVENWPRPPHGFEAMAHWHSHLGTSVRYSSIDAAKFRNSYNEVKNSQIPGELPIEIIVGVSRNKPISITWAAYAVEPNFEYELTDIKPSIFTPKIAEMVASKKADEGVIIGRVRNDEYCIKAKCFNELEDGDTESIIGVWGMEQEIQRLILKSKIREGIFFTPNLDIKKLAVKKDNGMEIKEVSLELEDD